MKRIRCPKCDEAILFDETIYEAGRILVFECPECHKRFRLRIPAQKAAGADDADETDEAAELPVYGYLTVIENAFHFKQKLPLREGDNVVGRAVKGSDINAPIRTVDPSVDTTHCIVTVKPQPGGTARFLVKDAPSNTGTFVENRLLGLREQARIDDGDIITIGATTMILHVGPDEEE